LISIGCAIMYPKSRDSQEVGVKDAATIRRCIFLSLRVKGHSRESEGAVARYADSRPIKARSLKGSCMGVAQMATMGSYKQ
jgi:hypothetical protein